MKQALWLFNRGIGDALLNLAGAIYYCEKNNLILNIFPHQIEIISPFYLYPQVLQSNVFNKYFTITFPNRVVSCDAKLLNSTYNNYGAFNSFDIPEKYVVPILKKYVLFHHDFDDTLYDKIKDMIGIHIRQKFNDYFPKNNSPQELKKAKTPINNVIQYLLSIRKLQPDKVAIALDNLWYLEAYKNLLNFNYFIIPDIFRANKQYKGSEINFSKYVKNGDDVIKIIPEYEKRLSDSIKEAFYISKCKKFIPSNSSFSLFICYLYELRQEGKI